MSSYDPGPKWWLDKTAEEWLRNRGGKRKRRKKRNVNKPILPPKYWRSYKEYLQSEWWKKKKFKKLKSVGFRCQQCSAKRELQTHHLHYKSLGRERLEDLRVLCKACHYKEHELTIEANRHLDSIQNSKEIL